jgi:hypothetical protein
MLIMIKKHVDEYDMDLYNLSEDEKLIFRGIVEVMKPEFWKNAIKDNFRIVIDNTIYITDPDYIQNNIQKVKDVKTFRELVEELFDDKKTSAAEFMISINN